MKLAPRCLPVLVLLLLVWPLAATGADAARKDAKKKDPASARTLDQWLLLGPVRHVLPVFHEAEKRGHGVDDLLDEEILPTLPARPAGGDAIRWFSGEDLVWADLGAGPRGRIALERPEAGGPAVAWAAAYLESDRWRSLDLEITGDHPRRAWLDGRPVASGGNEPDAEVKAGISLTTGRHLLLVKTVLDPEREADWWVGATVTAKNEGGPSDLGVSSRRDRDVNLADILDAPRITSLAVSPDGSRVVVSVTRVVPGTGDSESWVEIRRTADGAPVESWRGRIAARSVAWSPDGKYVSYVAETPGKKKDALSSLYLVDVGTGTVSVLLEGIENLSGYSWSPTGAVVAFTTKVEAEKDERGVKILEGLMDRWAGHRDREYLHLAAVPGGARRTLTAGELTTSAVAFAPDGRRLLFTRQVEAPDERPYTRTELWEVDLETYRSSKLREFGWFRGAEYSPDGTKILVAADAGAFGEIGIDLVEGTMPNSYDGQLFLWDPVADKAEALTREFDPAITSFSWGRHDGAIYVTAEDRDFVRLYRHTPGVPGFVPLDTGADRVRRFDLAHGAPVAVALGSSPWVPQSLFGIDLEATSSRRLRHPGDDWFRDVRSGGIEPWSFTASSGRAIDGRIYLPPGFDDSREYPAIVYYYGGTSPVTREFGGRYPKEWWAANGYVVYVPQPSGATGFGQAFSATHVNDWGKTTTREIIEGTRAFLEAHPYVDPKRVGCIGASYGGFMTMLLSTETDLFAAAVAHAGISSLSSYWGEGYWGAMYSAVATAGSFPWNRPDIYVDQSPLFRADRNRVPILLTHGAADTNVPPGESDQFYVALKLLGKQVEYLQVAGQNHFIMEHDKRVVWSESIVAWFDRWLKGQPDWWNELWPSRAAPDEPDAD